MTPAAPQPLDPSQLLKNFRSGTPALDEWLQRRAAANQASGASRTYVVVADGQVVAYYALASGSIATVEAAGRFRRNMPEPIPVVVLARLAVDERFQGRGFGRGLVRDAAKRALVAGAQVGIRGLVVHAISEDAKAFYLALGFLASPVREMTLMIPLGDLAASL